MPTQCNDPCAVCATCLLSWCLFLTRSLMQDAARHICYSICERLRLEASVWTAWSFRMSAYVSSDAIDSLSSLRFSTQQTCFSPEAVPLC